MTFGAPAIRAGSGDNYPGVAPRNWRSPVAQDSVVDSWGYYNRECTSWAAWALHDRNGFEMPRAIGNGAGDWGTWASSHGYAVDTTPKTGSIAWWSYGAIDNGVSDTYGHVAYVSAVNGSSVFIEEYNYGFNGFYHTRTITPSSTQQVQFIHFKDAGGHLTQMNNDGSGWNTWDISNGNQASGTPFVLWGSGILDIYTVNGAGGLDQYHQDTTTGVWSVYNVLSGTNFTQGVAGTLSGSTLNLFIPDTSGQLHHIQKPSSGSWANYTISNGGSSGNNIYGTPGLLWTSGSVSVFGVNQSGNLLQYYVPQGQTTWAIYNVAQPTPAWSGGVSVFQLGSYTYVHGTNTSHRLIEAASSTGSWIVASVSQVTGSSTDVADTPGVIFTANTIDLFPRGSDGSLQQFHADFTAGTWTHYANVRPSSTGLTSGTNVSVWSGNTEVFGAAN